jgi:serine/threonine protein kinase
MNDAVSMESTGAAAPLPLSTVIGGRFQIQAFVRAEAGTELYQAVDTRDNVPVSLRVFSFSPTMRSILESDLNRATVVTHKNLITVTAWGYEGARAYLATEPLEGATLREIIDSRRATSQVVGLAHAHVLLGHAANALEAAYPNLCHGGVHPDAIRLTSSGRVKVANLGLTRAVIALARVHTPQTQTGNSPYLAPEVASGAAPSSASDVYSLTAIFYELITGRAPGTPTWPASQVNAEVPKAIDKLIDRGLASLPETRFVRPSQLLGEIGQIMSSTPAQPDRSMAPPRLTLGKSFSVSDAVRISEEYERWLVQKDNLDFGPFSLAQVMAQMEKGIFNGEHFIVDADSGDRQKIKDHPQLAEFTRVVERKLEAQRRSQAEQAHEHSERSKGRWFIAIIGLALLAVAAGMWFYLKNRKAAQDESLASRVSESEVDKFLSGVKVEFAPPKHIGGGRRSTGGGVAGRAEDFSNNMDLGDISKEGGDAVLDEGTVDKVMRANYRKIVPCAMQGGIRTVEIDFVIQPTGRVKAVRVNGQGKGAMPVCVLNQMQSFGFPTYKGKNTIASWSMSFR